MTLATFASNNVRIALVSTLASVLLLACGEDTNPMSEDTVDPNAEGVWASRGYGYVLQVADGRATLFESTDVSCIELEDRPVFEVDRVATDTLEVDDGDAFSPYVFDRLDALPDTCANGGTPVVGDATYERDAALIFDIVQRTFAEHYAFFELREADWEALTEHAGANISSDTSDAALFEALVALTGPLDDGHVTIVTPDDDYESGRVEFLELLRHEFEAQSEVASLEAYVSEQFDAHIAGLVAALDEAPIGSTSAMLWGSMGGDIGYVGYFNFEPENPTADLDELDAALEAMADTDALVIDLRFNEGGSDRYALDVASRFFDQSRPVFRKAARHGDTLTDAAEVSVTPFEGLTYTKPVYVLTTHSTVSAAEVFTLSMAELPHVVVAGHPSNGIFSDALSRQLPNGWTFTLSNEVYSSVDGDVYEGAGVSLDLPLEHAAFPLQDRTSGHDSWLAMLAQEIRSAG